MRRDIRSGSVLIIIVGLSSVMLVLAVTFLARMRSDARAMALVVADAQARLMLHAALMYLQETSRIGWGDATGECYGWTDVRDGGLGPRGPRPANAGGDGSAIPAPSWYRWSGYRFDADDADLPPIAQRRGGWPLPGTATRCPMALLVRPPYAIAQRVTYNPVRYPLPYDGGSAAWDATWDEPTTGNDYADFYTRVRWDTSWAARAFDQSAGALGMLDPQPVARAWESFRDGATDPGPAGLDWIAQTAPGDRHALSVVPGTENQSWFRVYREVQRDHDDLDNVGRPGTEWWDKVALYDPAPPIAPPVPSAPARRLRNWSVFIVACGAGGTRGYRFWDDDAISRWESSHGLEAGSGRALEPVTAEESGLFINRQQFEDLLSSSRVLWFRCEWSGLQSGARNAGIYNAPMWRANALPVAYDGRFQWGSEIYLNPQFNAQYAQTEVLFGEDDVRSNSPRVFAGNIKWLQRLDRDPVLW
jgi:hypothetical protein